VRSAIIDAYPAYATEVKSLFPCSIDRRDIDSALTTLSSCWPA
jgi:hypothetical protein